MREANRWRKPECWKGNPTLEKPFITLSTNRTGHCTYDAGSRRAEELAAEVFWKFWRNPRIPPHSVSSWLYRSAVRTGLDELRRRHRRSQFEKVFGFLRVAPSPEQLLAINFHLY